MSKVRKKVAVIGAGPSGLAAARQFTQAGSPFECQVFEQGDDLGGTWRYSERVGTDDIGRPIHTSMYKSLRTNLPKEIMCYPDYPFPEYDESYLPADQVLKYLHDYADHFHLRQHIKFNQNVKEVKPLISSDKETTWVLTVFDWMTKESTTLHFDAVMLCIGHFTVPNIPVVRDSEVFIGKIMHSHDYRQGEPFKGQRVLVVGGAFSAFDITLEVSQHAESVTLSHHLSDFKSKFPANVEMAPDLDFYFETGAQFKDGRRAHYDTVIYCTGYLYRFPCLHADCKITTDGYGVEPLFKHLINIEHPTMCIVANLNYISPLQLADLQARFFFKFLDGSFHLPSKEEMYSELKREQKFRQEELGFPPRKAHKLGPMQRQYYDDLSAMANLKTIDPVVTKLHTEGGMTILKEIDTFRNRRYRIVDSENYIQLQ